MDQVTHLVSGVIQGRFFASRSELTHILPITILGALIPDIDIITILWGKEEYVIHHRALSHGIFFSFLWAFLIISIVKGTKKDLSKNFARFFLIALICILGHLYLDLMTSYGTSILSPALKNRYALDAMFIVDPIYWLILLIAYFFMKVKRVNKKSLYTVLVIIWFLYPLACLATKLYVEHKMERRYAHLKVNIIPDLFTPFMWKVIIQDGDNFSLRVYNILTKEEAQIKNFKRFNLPNPSYDWEKDRFLNFFLKQFLRFPVEESEGDHITIYDLRFYPTLDFQRNIRKSSPFALKIAKDLSGKLMWYEYGGKRKHLNNEVFLHQPKELEEQALIAHFPDPSKRCFTPNGKDLCGRT